MSSEFATWFAAAFGHPVPDAFEKFLSSRPNGAENGFGPRLWPADRVMVETDDRGLAEKGVCLIGASDSIAHILMRAKDGKVFIVDNHDYGLVDAWFSDVTTLCNLLNLE
jgi:hypothetical protein